MLDVQEIRKDFPILGEKMNDRPLVYLDSAATSLKPVQVLEALELYNTKKTANVHRGVYRIAAEATELYEGARKAVARFLGAAREREIVFTSGATASLNLVAQSWGFANLRPGDEILTSELEHHSSILPWQNVAKYTGAVLKLVPLSADGRISLENVEAALSERTKIVALTYVSNVMGYITPIKEICDLAHKRGAMVTVDAAQAAPHLKINVQELGCDFLSITGHKMLGPSGVGALYARWDILSKMPPVLFGGEMVDTVRLDGETSFKNPPYRFEVGTPNVAGVIGLTPAIEYLERVGLEAVHAYELTLRDYAMEGLRQIEGVTIYNPGSDTGIITFNVDGVHPHDMATVFDAAGVCVRAGHHCAQPLMKRLCQAATIRAACYLYNTREDIDALIGATIAGKEAFADGVF